MNIFGYKPGWFRDRKAYEDSITPYNHLPALVGSYPIKLDFTIFD
jgi:hypothetical protein